MSLRQCGTSTHAATKELLWSRRKARIQSALHDVGVSIFGGKIEYGDYGSEAFEMDENNAFTPILHKRLSFSYEAEYRLVYWDTSVVQKELVAQNGVFHWGDKILPDIDGRGKIKVSKEPEEINLVEPRPGHDMACDVNALANKIYVSPLAADWFVEVVKVATESYGLTAPVTRSSLLADPLR